MLHPPWVPNYGPPLWGPSLAAMSLSFGDKLGAHPMATSLTLSGTPCTQRLSPLVTNGSALCHRQHNRWLWREPEGQRTSIWVHEACLRPLCL